MRHLPAEQNGEQRTRFHCDLPLRRRPADDRRQRPGHCADEGVEARHALKRGVDEHVTGHRQGRQHAADRVYQEKQVEQSACRQPEPDE